ncbi:MAG: hypothetical protein KF795_09400 [Labilithrix sp.]|nr:hypothetical protein [Labilithrix sp.]
MDRVAAEKALVKLAKQTASTWQRMRGETFLGETLLETGNTVYRFVDGVFSGRAPKPAAGQAPAWESPPAMRGVELIGFLADEGGLWSLSPRWRSGSLAVITTNAQAFTLTSPTLTCATTRPAAHAARPLRRTPERSDVFTVPSAPPPTVRRPAPPSMTRLQTAPAPAP